MCLNQIIKKIQEITSIAVPLRPLTSMCDLLSLKYTKMTFLLLLNTGIIKILKIKQILK